MYVNRRSCVAAFPPLTKSTSNVLGTNSGLAPVVHVINVVVTESIGQSIPSIVTAISPAESKKFSPAISIYVPPMVVPSLGVIEVTLAVLASVYSTISLNSTLLESLYTAVTLQV